MKTEEQIKELAYKRYGTDYNSFGGQRDGFREGYRICQESLQKTESDNNGWVKIESEEQYDELENGEYEWYNINNSKYDKGDLWAYGTFTHYKIVPIFRSDAPLY